MRKADTVIFVSVIGLVSGWGTVSDLTPEEESLKAEKDYRPLIQDFSDHKSVITYNLETGRPESITPWCLPQLQFTSSCCEDLYKHLKDSNGRQVKVESYNVELGVQDPTRPKDKQIEGFTYYCREKISKQPLKEVINGKKHDSWFMMCHKDDAWSRFNYGTFRNGVPVDGDSQGSCLPMSWPRGLPDALMNLKHTKILVRELELFPLYQEISGGLRKVSQMVAWLRDPLKIVKSPDASPLLDDMDDAEFLKKSMNVCQDYSVPISDEL